MSEKKVLEMKGITKIYPGVRALDGVDFIVEEGSVHALMGENGAGKSTLIKILTGVIGKDSGSIVLSGELIFTVYTKQIIMASAQYIRNWINTGIKYWREYIYGPGNDEKRLYRLEKYL